MYCEWCGDHTHPFPVDCPVYLQWLAAATERAAAHNERHPQ